MAVWLSISVKRLSITTEDTQRRQDTQSYFPPSSVPGAFHLQFNGKWLEELVYCISPIRPRDITVPRRDILPVMRIPPSKLPVNNADHLVTTNNDVGRVQIAVSEDRGRPGRLVLHADHLFDVVPFAVFDVVLRS